MSELSELEYFFSNLNYEHLFAVEGKKLTKEQAEEIIHRCNCHDELVAALEKQTTFNSTNLMINHCPDCEYVSDDTDQESCGKCLASQDLQQAKAALAKVEKE